MDVGSLEAWESFIAQASSQEVAAFYEGIHAGVNGEDVPLCAPCEGQDDEPLDSLERSHAPAAADWYADQRQDRDAGSLLRECGILECDFDLDGQEFGGQD